MSHAVILPLAISNCSVHIPQTPIGTSPHNLLHPRRSPRNESFNGYQCKCNPHSFINTSTCLMGDLHLTGKLVYMTGGLEDKNFFIEIQIIDLVMDATTSAFKTPLDAWLYYIFVFPDSKQLVKAYSPPPGENQSTVQVLYTMPLDGSEVPQLLFAPPSKDDGYIQVEWSPDGDYIYYTNFNNQIPNDSKRIHPPLMIYRMRYPDGQPKLVADQAYWSCLSSDSSRLLYISVNPFSIENKLMIADPDGDNAHEISFSGSQIPNFRDAPFFTPDGRSIFFSGPSPVQSVQPPSGTGMSGFYFMPWDSSQAPLPLLVAPSAQDVFYQPRWSPDGKYVYFTHTNDQGATTYEMMRMSYPDGGVETLVDQAYWPNVSEDGSHITYVSVDPQTGTNSPLIANADGMQAQQVPLSDSGVNIIIDAPIFYPDNQSILFSTPVSQQFSSPNWVDKILGITIAYAHGAIPSEWWSIPLAGGKSTQLTRVGLHGLFASFSPDRRYIASFSTNGIFRHEVRRHRSDKCGQRCWWHIGNRGLGTMRLSEFGESFINKSLLKPPSSAARTPPRADFLKTHFDNYLLPNIVTESEYE